MSSNSCLVSVEIKIPECTEIVFEYDVGLEIAIFGKDMQNMYDEDCGLWRSANWDSDLDTYEKRLKYVTENYGAKIIWTKQIGIAIENNLT